MPPPAGGFGPPTQPNPYGGPGGAPGADPYGFGYGAPASHGELATWLPRVGAYLVDSLIADIPGAIGNILTSSSDGGGAALVGVLFSLIGLGITIWNRWIRAGKTGQSIGKSLVGLRLVDQTTGQPIGAGKAFLRDICHIVDAIICYIGFLFPLWDKQRQTLADKIVGTLVTKV